MDNGDFNDVDDDGDCGAVTTEVDESGRGGVGEDKGRDNGNGDEGT